MGKQRLREAKLLSQSSVCSISVCFCGNSSGRRHLLHAGWVMTPIKPDLLRLCVGSSGPPLPILPPSGWPERRWMSVEAEVRVGEKELL